VAWLLGSLREMGARDQAAALLRRDPAVRLGDPRGRPRLDHRPVPGRAASL